MLMPGGVNSYVPKKKKERNSNFPFRQENKFIDQDGKCGGIIVP